MVDHDRGQVQFFSSNRSPPLSRTNKAEEKYGKRLIKVQLIIHSIKSAVLTCLRSGTMCKIHYVSIMYLLSRFPWSFKFIYYECIVYIQELPEALFLGSVFGIFRLFSSLFLSFVYFLCMYFFLNLPFYLIFCFPLLRTGVLVCSGYSYEIIVSIAHTN